MSTKANYTAEEWQTLRDTPHALGMAVAMAGSSGLFGTISEMFSAGKMVAEAATGGNELIKGLLENEELKASQDSLKMMAKAQDTSKLPEWILSTAVADCKQAVDILMAKGSPGEKDIYVKFLLDMANNVASAAKEGGFLGFGGERVSVKEREALAAIKSALGVATAGSAA